MQLSSIVNTVSNTNLICDLLSRTEREDNLNLNGTSRLANGIILSSLAKTNNSPLLIIVPTIEEAAKWYPILCLLGWDKSNIYPSSEVSPFDDNEPSTEILWGQLQVLSELISEENNQNYCIVATERCLQPHLPPPEFIKKLSIQLKDNMDVDLEDLSNKLTKIGYERRNTVDQEGTWSRRGDIVDIYPVNNELPIRVEFFGDAIDKIKEFDPISQRSQDRINTICITPIGITPLISEKILEERQNINLDSLNTINPYSDLNETDKVSRKLLGVAWKKPSNLIDYINDETLIVIEDKNQCIAHGNYWVNQIQKDIQTSKSILDIYDKEACTALLPNVEKTLLSLDEYKLVELSSTNNINSTSKNNHDINEKSLQFLPNQFGKLATDIKDYIKQNNSIFLLSAQPSRAVALLQEHDCHSQFVVNPVDYETIKLLNSQKIPVALKCTSEAKIEGFYLPTFKILIITDKEFFGQQSIINSSYIRRRRKAHSKSIDPYKLHPGDYVVHRSHGIGIFKKIEKVTMAGEIRDYLVVKYLDGTLRVAADQLGSLGRYRSSSDKAPKINKLGGTSWFSTKERARKGLKKVALDLVKLYAEREKQSGFAYPQDGPWQKELEDSFPYEATKDQVSAVLDVKKDMENEKPMDRLVCGDVGFGKTEVAIRAIFKAITSGKQIALLAPTTILAQQHWRTLSERFAPYPIKVSLLNRFRTTSEKNEILEGLDEGTIDAVVGTHQLLNKKTKFAKLGLLVIDEEQRFGVNQKEKIKSLKKSVDVLTLSATPIPRTLYMSLSGVREMSLITTPPPLRRSIKTNLSHMDDEAIRSAIKQELDRGGQVFYVVPRVDGIEEIGIKLRNMIPNIKLIIAHGQMSEGDLENSMIAFNEGEADLMLCTTIIESGLDIPRVNTIIIEDSHRFGLAQLYQLRGRVGRSGIQAYAWLFYPDKVKLNDSSRQRLKAIQQFTSLGSGYQLSMRDMEIRGVGNLLGVEQSGQMEIIGFDLYMELLQEALSDIQGQNIPKVDETQIDLPLTAFIPADYIIDNDEKIAAYRFASKCNTRKEIIELAANWTDRYGPIPKAVESLLELMKLKIIARKCGITRIRSEKPNIVLETNMDEPGFKLLRKGLPNHLHGRLIYKRNNRNSEVLARGIALQSIDKQIDQLISWFELMESQITPE
ncbi:transcription-repair coupling factor [Prochlorococcus sp. MIT 1223]|uniref:transcription-repair coupling factor n=1 Tax=Prochlorococcus sp. MIT 1223 TaxID=3096217 RepID=UPI002A753047|nr:transcription-repair coupling factor [Prochlorococcus sp. MIT 1223]